METGAVAALGSRSATPAHAPGLALAEIAGLLALRALLPQHFPTWEVAALEQKIPWLRAAVVTLALAVLATALGTIVD